MEPSSASASLGRRQESLDALCCPLTLSEFSDPVILIGDGHTYERAAITEWLKLHPRSPLTGAMLSDASQRLLVPNLTLKKMADEVRTSGHRSSSLDGSSRARALAPEIRRPVSAHFERSRRSGSFYPAERPPPPLPPARPSSEATSPRSPNWRPPPPPRTSSNSSDPRSPNWRPPPPARRTSSNSSDLDVALELVREELRLEDLRRRQQQEQCKNDALKAHELAKAEGTLPDLRTSLMF